MPPASITARVDATGHLPEQVRRRISTLLTRHKNHPVTLTIARALPTRSSPANRRYWSMLHVAAGALGYDSVNELHEGLAMRLLRIEDDPVLGTPRRTSTSTLDSAAFVAYADAAMRLLIDYGADLTDWDGRPGADLT
jgi:hypothetical protein|tara:strand:- start:1927 stop:2340 length:414 start_codon:yes stop_codon:yes gene_type:complete